ncbi:MAG TPA: sigma 54-interacting transcriptional regulator [Polyangia bacterium]|jgi:DNA-binding NtrC family response regulator|nr:sigma 54-interacting transcriptional regulator [Polyangia bacterium]
MSNPHTNPRLVSPTGENDGKAAVLILAGHASKPLPLDRPRIAIVVDEMELGRDRVCDSWSTDFDDPMMSRRHARIDRAPAGDYFVTDLGSTNGTWLDGRDVPAGASTKLEPGAVLMLGSHVFVFRFLSHDELAAIREDWSCPFGPVPTLSASLAVLTRKLSRLAPSSVDVLLSGETGVGKEVHAEAIHRASGRKGPFIAINCAAIPDTLVESELFGYARGAHSTADRGKPGLIEQAEGGTLFLDEIGDMSQIAQTKLLRFLQSREFLALGTTRQRTLDVRVVAATNRALEQDAADEGLRADLAARLGPEPMVLPPLRERPEDVGLLAAFFAKVELELVPEAFQALFLHPWKGNVRELEKVIALARVLAGDGAPIALEHLPMPMAARAKVDAAPTKPLGPRKRPTRDELRTLLARHGGDVAQLAREIGRQRTLVWRWLRENELRPDDYRS